MYKTDLFHLWLLYRIAITKLDILDDFEEIKIGVGYRLNGQKLDSFPGIYISYSSSGINLQHVKRISKLWYNLPHFLFQSNCWYKIYRSWINFFINTSEILSFLFCCNFTWTRVQLLKLEVYVPMLWNLEWLLRAVISTNDLILVSLRRPHLFFKIVSNYRDTSAYALPTLSRMDEGMRNNLYILSTFGLACYIKWM